MRPSLLATTPARLSGGLFTAFCDIIRPMDIYLHVCCGDCLLRFLVASGYPLPETCYAYIQDYTSLPQKTEKPRYTLVFYNPNIYPRSEYQARLAVVRTLANQLSLPLQVADYRPSDYFALPAVQAQLATDTRDPQRCRQCQKLRLHFTLEALLQNLPQDGAFSTTMLASQYLNHQQIAHIGHELATTSNHPFVAPSFLFSPDKLHTSGYYKQNYCGCFFSLQELTQHKYRSLAQKT